MTQPYRVQSTSRKSGRQTTLDPRFLNREAAQSYLANLERKAGQWYTYAVIDPASAEGDTAWRDLGIDPAVAKASTMPRFATQDGPGRTQAPSEDREALQAPWEPSEADLARHQAEVKAMEIREWKKFQGHDLNAKATPEWTYEVNADGMCLRCAGTGQFCTGTLNGKPTGPGGICFRCNGKGVQTLDDVKRNGYRDRHQRVSL